MNNIYISETTLARLAEKAIGFSDTPESVIIRLLNECDGDKSFKPELHFYPNEIDFKKELIKYKIAEIIVYYDDGNHDVITWVAERFNNRSNLRANIWSGHLRKWKSKHIIKAEFSVPLTERE